MKFPYTMQPSGKVVLDEWCYCGCKRSSHAEVIARFNNEPCTACKCCLKFRHSEYIFDDPLKRLKGRK